MDKTLRKQALELVRAEDIGKFASDMIKRLNKVLKSQKIGAEAMLGGSIAKGTNLKDKYDIDIFVRFKDSKKNISDELERVIRKLGIEYKRVHGSRDYFQITDTYTYEIVPVLKVENALQAENVSDMSPLHVEYFNKSANKIKGIRDEIRLTKRFMQAARIYGAESYIKGFSGHVCDLLIIHYGSFEELVNKAKNWKEKKIIDIEKHHKFPMLSLNESKLQSPLILVDPVQPQRNAAAALSEENYKKFISQCSKFARKPSLDFFRVPSFDEILDRKLNATKQKHKIFIIKAEPLKEKKDVAGAKVLKVKEHIECELRENDFEILWSEWEFDEKESRIAICIKDEKLSETKEVEGPEITMTEHVLRFKKKYKKTTQISGRLYSEVKRKYVDAEKLIRDLLASKFVKEKVKKIKI